MSKSTSTRPANSVSRKSFNTLLSDTRKGLGKSQDDVAKLLGVSAQMVGRYESGETIPDAPKILQLAKYLSQDPGEWVLRADLEKARSGGCEAGLIRVIQDMLRHHCGNNGETCIEHRKGYLSLEDFPHCFEPIAVIVGDKREEHPNNAGDLYAFSASTVDDRWLASLRLPADTEKYPDKIFAHGVADQEWLEKQFGRRHLLTIGSPASNLFTRRYNKCFLFRFAISRETENRWNRITREEYPNLHTPADLRKFVEVWQNSLGQMMRMFKQPGFVNFNYEHLKLGIDQNDDQDFAVISLGRNPFAKEQDPFYSIMVAGVHHPGTAQALKYLSEPSHFAEHPFGGVLEIEVPSKKLKPLDVKWYQKIEKSHSFWHDVSGKSLRYTPNELRNNMKRVKDQLQTIQGFLDFLLESDELDLHMKLVDQLAPISTSS